MRKYLNYGKFLLGWLIFLPLLLGCANLSFFDRGVSMKESCVLELYEDIAGDEDIFIISGHNEERGQIDSIGVYKSISIVMGKNAFILPAGKWAIGHSERLKNILKRDVFGSTMTGISITEIYRWENYNAISEIFTFEVGKRYRIEVHSSSITITEMNSSGISRGGVTAAIRSGPVINALGWRYNNGIVIGEFGPQIGVSVVSDAMVMHIAGEATIGIGVFGIPDHSAFGFPYRLGGAVTAFFGKSRFGLGLGGGITGQSIYFNFSEGESDDLFPKIQAPYIQIKGLFREKRGDGDYYSAMGFFADYYPTVTPVGIGTFGLGFTMNW